MSFVLKKVEEIRKELEDIKIAIRLLRDHIDNIENHIDNIEKILNVIVDWVKKRIEVEEEIFYMKYNEF